MLSYGRRVWGNDVLHVPHSLRRLCFCRIGSTNRSLAYCRWHSTSSPNETPSTELEAVSMAKKQEKDWIRSLKSQNLLKSLMTSPKQPIPTMNSRVLKDWHTYFHDRYPQTSASAITKDPIAMRVISNISTFPLTLSFGLNKIFHEENSMSSIKALVIGARDESQLPLPWWQNLLHSFQSSPQLHLEMIGPEMSSKLDNQVVNNTKPSTTSPTDNELTLVISAPAENKTLLTDHPGMHEKLLHSDVFVLFNPGFGASDVMKSQWKDSLYALLQTRKPVICTAHSEKDLDRDLAFIDTLVADDTQELGEPLEVIQQPQANPFQSLSQSIDKNERDGQQVIAFNSFIYSFRLK